MYTSYDGFCCFLAGVDEVNGTACLDALAVLVHQRGRHLHPLNPHHRDPGQHRVQGGYWCCARLFQPPPHIHLPHALCVLPHPVPFLYLYLF